MDRIVMVINENKEKEPTGFKRLKRVGYEFLGEVFFLGLLFMLVLAIWRYGFLKGLLVYAGGVVFIVGLLFIFLRLKRIVKRKVSRVKRKEVMNIGLRQWLETRVVGQREAIEDIVSTILINTKKQEESSKPKRLLGVFMFVGMTGIGKTETAKALGEWFNLKFGHQFLRFDMGNFSDRHMANTLTGSPKGYIGSEEGGALTRPLMINPLAVILFDEIEKGDRSLYKTFMSLIDEGLIQETSTGKFAMINQGIVIFTSNLMQGTINALHKNIKNKIEREIVIRDTLTGRLESALRYIDREIIEMDLRQKAGDFLPPEFIGRIDKIVVFNELSDHELFDIMLNIVRKSGKHLPNTKLFEIFEKTKPIAKTYGVRQFIKKVEEELW